MLPAQRPSSPTFYLALTPALPLLFPAPGRPRRRSGVEESAPSSAWRSYERFVHFRKFVRASAAINLYTALANFHDLRNFKFSFKIAYRRPLTPPPSPGTKPRAICFLLRHKTGVSTVADYCFLPAPSYLSPHTPVRRLPTISSPVSPHTQIQAPIQARHRRTRRNLNARLIEPGAPYISMKLAIDSSHSRVPKKEKAPKQSRADSVAARNRYSYPVMKPTLAASRKLLIYVVQLRSRLPITSSLGFFPVPMISKLRGIGRAHGGVECSAAEWRGGRKDRSQARDRIVSTYYLPGRICIR